jgi:hypothetical protein
VRAALKLERDKVAELQRKEQERKLKKSTSKRQAAAAAKAAASAAAKQSDAERLQAWQAEERHRRLSERSAKMIEAPPVSARGRSRRAEDEAAASDEDAAAVAIGKGQRIPLGYLCRHKMVAWELPGRRFAPLIGFTPSKDPADDSPDEW